MTQHALRILLSIHHALNADSGAPGVTFSLGQALRELGHAVEFLSFDEMPKLPARVSSLVFPAFATLSLARRHRHLDVVDASTGDMWIWAELRRCFPRRSQGPLLVSRSHGLEHLFHEAATARALRKGERLSWRYGLYQGRYRLWEVAANLRLADVALFLNPTERDFAVEKLGVDAARARVLPNGIPDVFFDREPPPTPRDPAAPAGIVQIGAWRELKGADESVAAMSEVLGRNPGETMSYLGTGVPEHEIRDLFPPAVRDRVRVVPFYRRTDLPELLDGNTVQIFPTFSEGFGLGLLEGMARGLAPVASAVAGPSSLVVDGESGILVPAGDSAAIARSVEALLTDRDRLEELREAARQSARGFAQSRIAAATVAIYREALAGRLGRVPS